MLANNGFVYRNILRSEKVKEHFTSSFSKENTMSPEDILLETPKEDLHYLQTKERYFKSLFKYFYLNNPKKILEMIT